MILYPLPRIGLLCLALWLGLTNAANDKNGWSWQDTPDSTAAESVSAPAADYAPDDSSFYVPSLNSTEAEEFIDTILTSNRQGRNIEGLDDVYGDPNVKKALDSGDDLEARNLIRGRLCNLGLMQCDDGSFDSKRYVAPEDLIYAQPVDIKPIGQPIPSIAIRGPPRSYGAQKPSYPRPPVPPRKVGYGGLQKPGFPPTNKYGPPGPYLSQGNYASSSLNTFTSGVGGPSGPSYFSKPVGASLEIEQPYDFERPIKHGINNNKNLLESESVQHVHHHYHHGEGDSKKPTVIVNNPVPLGSHLHSTNIDEYKTGTVLNAGNGYQSGYTSGLQSENNYASGGFSPINNGFGSSSGGLYNSAVKPVYENTQGSYSSSIYKATNTAGSGVYNLGYAPNKEYASNTASSGVYNSGYAPNKEYASNTAGIGVYNSAYAPNKEYASNTAGIGVYNSAYAPSKEYASNGGLGSFGSTVGSYGNTNNFYKKELNTGAINNNLLGGGGSNQYSSQFGYNGQYNGIENYDCVCVPYDQCPSQDIIGRKDDLFLPIDPRNLEKDIDALPEEKVVITDGNGTMTVVTIKDVESIQNVTNLENNEQKKVAKREANDKASDSANKAIEPRQRGSDDNENRGILGQKVQPTFGVSFGLPNSGYGGYPLNPFGPNPVVNPYGSSIGGGGLNLGLVSVDPLVSVQVTKNDYGEKVVKPLVNLHVTPNGNFIHKLGSIFSHKKELLFGGGGYGGGGFGGGGYGGGFGGHGGGYPVNIHEHYHHGSARPPHYHHGPPAYHGHHGPPPHYISHRPPRPPPYFGSGPGVYPYSGPGGFRTEIDDDEPEVDYSGPYTNDANDFGSFGGNEFYGRSSNDANNKVNNQNNYAQNFNSYSLQNIPAPAPGQAQGGRNVKFPSSRRRRETVQIYEDVPTNQTLKDVTEPRNIAVKRQAFLGQQQQCGPRHVCCKRPNRPQIPNNNLVNNRGQCGVRHSNGINGRIKNPSYVDGDSEFGEYPWQAAILKKDPKESVYVCGGTLIDNLHIVTAAHCVKTYSGFDLRVRLGEWDVNHDVEFFQYIERDVISVHIHPQYYAGTLDNDLALLKLDRPVEWTKYPHISPACLPDKFTDFTGARCWTTGWGKDAFGDFGKYQNILKEVDVPIIGHHQCEAQLRQTRLGYQYQLNPGFICAGGEEGKDACKGDGGGPMVCERGGRWHLVGVVSWGIGCGQANVPGVYVKVAHYLDWIAQITGRF